jgi:recombination protein RecT
MNAQLQNNRSTNPVASFNAFMQKHKSQLELALPKHLNADRMVRLSLTAFSQNPALQQCDPKTIFGSIIVASQLGLEIGVNGQGYLVPYKGKCTFVPGWKGLVDLANRGGRCTVWTGAVYEGDEFDYMLGDSPYCKHKPCGEFEESKLTHVYAIGRVKDSEMPVIEVWPIKKVHAHFKKTVVPALQPNHYSKKHLEAYAKKVALLQVLKYMPQSIEMSNAVDVSYAAESGKGVTIDGDFVSIDNSPQDIQESNTQEERVIEHDQGHEEQAQTHDQEDVEYAPSFAQIKRGILSAKSPAHLDVMEEQAMDHADREERKQLMTLIKAQSQKFQTSVETASKKSEPAQEQPPTSEAENVQNTTSNDVAKKPTSTEVRKEYLDQIANFTHAKDLETIIPFIKGHEILTDAHKTYLVNAVNQKIEELSKPTGVDKIKSQSLINGLKTMVNDAQNMGDLQLVVEQFNGSKSKIDPAHAQDFLKIYSERKAFLEDQLSMFDEAPVQQASFADKAIARIYAAKNQDDINAEFMDPEFEEQSDQDKQRITIAAQEREQQLLG